MFMPSTVVATSAKDRIAIVEEKAWRIMRRKSIAELLRRSRMGGNRYVHDSSTVVREDDQSNNNRNVTVGTTKRSVAVIWHRVIRQKRCARFVTVDVNAVAGT